MQKLWKTQKGQGSSKGDALSEALRNNLLRRKQQKRDRLEQESFSKEKPMEEDRKPNLE